MSSTAKSSREKTVRWGVLGTGAIARSFARALHSLPDAQLLAIGSRAPSRAREFAYQFDVPRPYGSYEELVRDEDIDVVYVATPNTQHRENCILCLEAGKPVLCEKPFAINAEEAREVIALARRRQLFCMEAMWMRFVPLMAKLRSLIDSNVIGEVRMVTAQLGFHNEFDPNDRVFDPELGGGALLDLGVYPLSLAFQLLGPPSCVASHATMGSTGVDEQSAIVLGYPQGQLAILAASLRTQMPNEAIIMGDSGQIRIHAPMYRPHRLSITRHPQSASNPNTERRILPLARRMELLRKVYLRANRYLSPIIRGSRTVVQPIGGNGYSYEAVEVMRCLRAGECESKIMPLDETLKIMETMDTIRGQWNLTYPQERSVIR